MLNTTALSETKRIDSACEKILKVIKPGDVINQEGNHRWYEFWLAVTFSAIRHYQKKLFGRNSDWRDVHTMLYFDKENTFSVDLPKAAMIPLEKFCMTRFSIHRFKTIQLTSEYIQELREGADQMLGTDYDIGQLLDTGLNGLLGFNHQRRISIFDFGRKKKVCAVGVRICFEYLYQKRIKIPGSTSAKWLFDKMNPRKWAEKQLANFKGTDVEMTTPAHFANSDYFRHEFELISRFENGIKKV